MDKLSALWVELEEMIAAGQKSVYFASIFMT